MKQQHLPRCWVQLNHNPDHDAKQAIADDASFRNTDYWVHALAYEVQLEPAHNWHIDVVGFVRMLVVELSVKKFIDNK